MTTVPAGAAVIDASVGIRLVHDESGSAGASRLIRDARSAGRSLTVPSLFWLEVLNVLGRRYGLRPKILLQAVADLDAAGLETVDLDRPTLLLALDAVARYGLSAYDAAYLALAQAADAELLTADSELARAADAAGVRTRLVGSGGVSGRIGESTAPYAAVGSWADWPGAGPYLADLRARL